MNSGRSGRRTAQPDEGLNERQRQQREITDATASRKRSERDKSRHGVHSLLRRSTVDAAVASTRSDAIIVRMPSYGRIHRGLRGAALPGIQQRPTVRL